MRCTEERTERIRSFALCRGSNLARPHDRLQRRRTNACIEPEKPLPPASFDQNVLGLAGPTIARRHSHLEVTVGTDLRHHSRQRTAVSIAVRTDCDAGPGPAPDAMRRPAGEDAQTPTHPRAESGALCRQPASTESEFAPQTAGRPRRRVRSDCSRQRSAAVLGGRTTS